MNWGVKGKKSSSPQSQTTQMPHWFRVSISKASSLQKTLSQPNGFSRGIRVEGDQVLHHAAPQNDRPRLDEALRRLMNARQTRHPTSQSTNHRCPFPFTLSACKTFKDLRWRFSITQCVCLVSCSSPSAEEDEEEVDGGWGGEKGWEGPIPISYILYPKPHPQSHRELIGYTVLSARSNANLRASTCRESTLFGKWSLNASFHVWLFSPCTHPCLLLLLC